MVIAALMVGTRSGAQPAGPGSVTEAYRETAARLIGAAMVDRDGWTKLSYLTDRIGNRLSGSEALERAVVWAEQQMQADGLANVRVQPVMVPHWVRGNESAELVAPVRRRLAMLGLGHSVGTPKDGVTAEIVVVSSFEDLAARAVDEVEGKIVLFNVPYAGYGRTVRYRSGGASAAARKGAVAALVRSIGPVSLQTPHTGAMRYEDGVERIPTAALTIEGATLIQRLVDSGSTVRVRLRMEARTLPDAPSGNVMGEIVGRELPDEVVVLGGHLDSWDVGQGAQDDGSGCIAALQAVALIRQLGLQPRRTIRVVFWTNEENGSAGARAYREWVGDEVGQHVAGIEMDGGSEAPLGFGLTVPGADAGGQDPRYERAYALSQQILDLLQGIGAGSVFRGGGGSDIGPLMQAGMPGFGLRTVGERYFDWHHTEADTLDTIEPNDFRRNVAALAVLAYVLADMPERLVQ